MSYQQILFQTETNFSRTSANMMTYWRIFCSKPGYSAGSTLKLILPFFKANDITDRQMEDFSSQNIILIANSQTTLHYVQAITDAFIVSTSYQHYIKALCKALDFPYKNTYCTKVSLDKCAITPKEKDRLKEIAQEIAQMHSIDIPPSAKNIEDFSASDQTVIRRLDEVFWIEIPKMFIGKFLIGRGNGWRGTESGGNPGYREAFGRRFSGCDVCGRQHNGRGSLQTGSSQRRLNNIFQRKQLRSKEC